MFNFKQTIQPDIRTQIHNISQKIDKIKLAEKEKQIVDEQKKTKTAEMQIAADNKAHADELKNVKKDAQARIKKAEPKGNSSWSERNAQNRPAPTQGHEYVGAVTMIPGFWTITAYRGACRKGTKFFRLSWSV